MAVIKSGASAAQLAVDTGSSAARVTLYDPAGNALVSFIRGAGADLDTTAGVDTRDTFAVVVPGAGGAQVAGTAAVPLRTDPTGATTQPVSGAVSVTGTVAVSNMATTQQVAGTVAISNLPATQAVSVTNFPGTQTIAGTVTVANQPATQQIAGTVTVANQPATQTVAGAVSVTNLPATQAVSGTVSVAGVVNVNSLDPDLGASYTVAIEIVPTTVTTGTVYWSMRNSGSRTVYVKRLDLQQGFVGTAAASRSSYELLRYTGTPAGGTGMAAAKKVSSGPASTTTILTAPAGLTVTGLTYDAGPLHRVASANQLAATTTQDIDYSENVQAQVALAPGEGLAIRANGAVVAGSFLVGSIGWHEQ